jgi:hypothetical protein
LRKIGDEQQVAPEAGEPGSAHELAFLRCGFNPDKAQRLPFFRLRQDQDIDARDDAAVSAQSLDRVSQAGYVAASGKRFQWISHDVSERKSCCKC